MDGRSKPGLGRKVLEINGQPFKETQWPDCWAGLDRPVFTYQVQQGSLDSSFSNNPVPNKNLFFSPPLDPGPPMRARIFGDLPPDRPFIIDSVPYCRCGSRIEDTSSQLFYPTDSLVSNIHLSGKARGICELHPVPGASSLQLLVYKVGILDCVNRWKQSKK